MCRYNAMKDDLMLNYHVINIRQAVGCGHFCTKSLIYYSFAAVLRRK